MPYNTTRLFVGFVLGLVAAAATGVSAQAVLSTMDTSSRILGDLWIGLLIAVFFVVIATIYQAVELVEDFRERNHRHHVRDLSLVAGTLLVAVIGPTLLEPHFYNRLSAYITDHQAAPDLLPRTGDVRILTVAAAFVLVDAIWALLVWRIMKRKYRDPSAQS